MSKKLFAVKLKQQRTLSASDKTFTSKVDAKIHRESLNPIQRDDEGNDHEVFNHVVTYGPDHHRFNK